jgi:hypothetical protein
MRILLPLAVLLTTALASTSSAATTRPGAAAITHPAAATKVVLRVTTGGGFVTVQTNLRTMPSFTLYGDGSVIVQGPVTMIYPGPAITPLVRSHLSERQVQALLARAKSAGLLVPGRINYGDMGSVGISDAPTTTVFLDAGGRRVSRSAYALGVGAGHGRLTPTQASARAALARFVATLPHGYPGTQYTPHAVAVYVGPFRGPAQKGSRKIVWPLETSLATGGKRASNGVEYRCMFVGGTNATTLLAALHKANEQSRWIAHAGAAQAYEVIARPLLPDERRCP